jgi:hypothetical protein
MNNKSQFMRELNVSALNAINKQSELAYASRESGLTKVADMNRAQGRFNQSMMGSLEMGMKGAAGLKNPKDVVPGDAGFGPSPKTGKFRYGV